MCRKNGRPTCLSAARITRHFLSRPANRFTGSACGSKARIRRSEFLQNHSKELLPPFVSFIKMAHMAGSEDESKLVEQSLAGDPEAYAALVNQHQKMIRAVAFRMTGSLDDAEELAQDAFVRGYWQLESFSGGSKFSTWLCR